MLITDDLELAKRAKHITTTAKVPHPYEFVHDEIGYNYRMPNLNAALGCAQMERLEEFLTIKSEVASKWGEFCDAHGVKFARAEGSNRANHWLNAIILDSSEDRKKFITTTNEKGVMTRPIWQLMSELAMFKDCQVDSLVNSKWLVDRVVNIPSSVPKGWLSDLSED